MPLTLPTALPMPRVRWGLSALLAYAARGNRRLSRPSLARANIERSSILGRSMWPATGPALQGSVTPAFTASEAACGPAARRCRGATPLAMARVSQWSKRPARRR